jgi:Uma2 family endonuclease
MSSATLIPVEEYLRTSYRPDCDYVDGEVQERNFGEFDHATLQAALIAWFHGRRREWNILVLPEQRVQVSPARFRIPDVSILAGDYSREPIVRVPPLVCIEILSPEDRMGRVRERVNDYLSLGVKHIWVLDPATREAFIADAAGFHTPVGEVLSVPGTPIHLPLPQIFAELD